MGTLKQNTNVVNKAHDKIRALHGAELTAYVAIGERLKDMKGQVGHGGWSEYCDEHLRFNNTQAGRYMQCYDGAGYLLANTASEAVFEGGVTLEKAAKYCGEQKKLGAPIPDIPQPTKKPRKKKATTTKAPSGSKAELKEQMVELIRAYEVISERGEMMRLAKFLHKEAMKQTVVTINLKSGAA